VLCVTHLPQVAAQADVHLQVRKREEGGRTNSRQCSPATLQGVAQRLRHGSSWQRRARADHERWTHHEPTRSHH
jgi:DNA repair ATPase RecN